MLCQPMLRRIFTLLVMLVALFSLAAAQSEPQNRTQRAELRFLEGMTDHHQMALDMANDCLAKAETEAIRALCQDIIDAQSAEIDQMVAWLLDWYGVTYAPVSMLAMSGETTEMEDMDHTGHDMSEMSVTDPAMTMGMMAGLNRLEGAAYEIAWLESMIDHHDDAIHMAERMLSREPRPELAELAQAIIDAQRAEIEAMEALIVELGGV